MWQNSLLLEQRLTCSNLTQNDKTLRPDDSLTIPVKASHHPCPHHHGHPHCHPARCRQQGHSSLRLSSSSSRSYLHRLDLLNIFAARVALNVNDDGGAGGGDSTTMTNGDDDHDDDDDGGDDGGGGGCDSGPATDVEN